jgi:predicted RNA-binding Zn ribbon-like protein
MAHYDRPAAPDELACLEDFANSARFLYGEDHLAEPATARRWLADAGHPEAAEALDEAGRAALVEVREAVRDLLDGREAARAAATLNRHSGRDLGPPEWGATGTPRPRIRTDDPVRRVIAALLARLATAGACGGLERLKVCRAPECRWVFYDRSPANRSVWCSMSICGARHKMRSYRTRKQSEGADHTSR